MRMGNLLIYSATEGNFYIWPRALPRSLSRIAGAQTYPMQPVRLIVGYRCRDSCLSVVSGCNKWQVRRSNRCMAAPGEAVMVNTARSATADAFARAPLPKRFCNLDRLLHTMKARGLDGIVATAPWNVFYLTAFNGIAHKSDEPRPYAVILSRHMPDHPVLILADYYLATFLKQPTWVEDLRPFRAVMMPLDLPAQRSDIDRFIPQD